MLFPRRVTMGAHVQPASSNTTASSSRAPDESRRPERRPSPPRPRNLEDVRFGEYLIRTW